MHTVVNQLTLKPAHAVGVGARAKGRSIPATRRSEAGLRPRRGRGGDGLLAREGDNPLCDLGPPIVELAVE